MENIIDIMNVTFSYGTSIVLDNVSLSVDRGDFIGLVGENGTGKSTLIKLISGMEERYDGTIKIYGNDIKNKANSGKIGFVPQKANAFNTDFPATVEEIVGINVYNGLAFPWMNRDSRKMKVNRALELVGMKEHSKSMIGRLSGGQQQRVFIARAIAGDPEILLMDEPTVGIDVKSQEAVYCLLARLNQKLGITIIMVTHDIAAVTWHANKIALLKDGKIDIINPKNEEDKDRFSETFGFNLESNYAKHDCCNCEKWGDKL